VAGYGFITHVFDGKQDLGFVRPTLQHITLIGTIAFGVYHLQPENEDPLSQSEASIRSEESIPYSNFDKFPLGRNQCIR